MTRRAVSLLVMLLLAGCKGYPSEPANSTTTFMALMRGASGGEGYLEARYSPATRILRWRMQFSKLSGPVTWAFLQGPDGVGKDRADIVPINLQIEGGPIPGGATLTTRQGEDLMAGRWWVVLKTAEFPAGEIEGVLQPSQPR